MSGDIFLDLAQLVPSWTWRGIPIAIAAGVVTLRARTVLTAWPQRAERVEVVLPVISTGEAFDFARTVLIAGRCVCVPGSVDHDGLWRTVAQRPLAALVYAASEQPWPLAWLEEMVGQLGGDDEDGAWRAAVEAVGPVDSRLCEWVKSASAMERRQRGSVAVVMREAVAEYAAGQR